MKTMNLYLDKAIDALYLRLDAQIAAETDQLATLKTHKKGLMQQLFPSAEGARGG